MGRDDPPETFARKVGTRGLVQPHPLQRAIGAVVIGAGHRRPQHQPHIRHRLQFSHRLRCPVCRWHPANAAAFGQQAPAKGMAFFGQDHIRPGPPRRQRRHQTRWAGPDHQHIAEGKGLLIGAFVMRAGKAAKPRRAADDRLVQLFPKGARPHEGLVIEPRRQERRQIVVHRQKVEPQAAHPVLALRHQPFEHLLHRRPHVRGLVLCAHHLDQCIRFFRPRRQHTTRAVILERPPDQTHIIGQQGRRQRVALVPGIFPAIEPEADRFRAVDQTLALDPHFARPAFCSVFRSATSSTPEIACVTVLRVTSSHCEQPAS